MVSLKGGGRVEAEFSEETQVTFRWAFLEISRAFHYDRI